MFIKAQMGRTKAEDGKAEWQPSLTSHGNQSLDFCRSLCNLKQQTQKARLF